MSGYDHLLNKLKSKDVETRRNAVKTILDITYFDWVADRDERDIDFAIPALVESLNDPDKEVRELALTAIRTEHIQFNEKCVFLFMDKIIDVLFDEQRNELHQPISHLLKDAVVKGYDLSEHVERLSTFLKLQGEHPVKLGVADSLTFHFAVKTRWKELKALLTHEDKEIRQEAAGTLGRYELASKIPRSKLISNLESGLKDENEEVAFVTARSIISRSRDPDELMPAVNLVLSMAKDHPDKKLKNNAIMALKSLLDNNISCNSKFYTEKKMDLLEPVFNFLEKLYFSNQNKYKKMLVRTIIIYYLHTEQYEQIQKFLKQRSVKLKVEVLYALSGCAYNCKHAVESLITPILSLLLKTKNADLIKAASRRLNDFGKKKTSIAKRIYKEANANNIDLNNHWKFMEELIKSIHRKSLDSIMKDFKDMKKSEKLNYIQTYLTHENPSIRAFAAEKIHSLAYENISVKKALPLLIQLLSDNDPFVREKASQTISYISNKVNIRPAFSELTTLLQDDYVPIIDHATTAISHLAEQGEDISIAIPKLLPLIDHDDKNINYFSRNALERYIINQDRLQRLLTEAEKLDKYKEQAKQIIEKRKKYLLAVGKRYDKHDHLNKQAINTYSIYVAIDPENLEAQMKLAHAYFRDQQKEKAKYITERVLERDPNHFKAKKFIKRFD